MSLSTTGEALALVAGVLVALAVHAAGALHPTLTRPIGRSAASGNAPRAGGDEVADVVDIAERIARDVRSGVSLRDAVARAAVTAPEPLGEVAAALARDVPLREALAAHHPTRDERDLLVHALVLGTAHPEVVSSVLDRTSAVVRERRAWRLERHAHAAQARASARVLTLLPLGFAGWGVLTSASVRQAFTSSAAVAAVTAVGLGLNLLGWLWMRRVVGGRT
jgi:tight adherence protein B